MARELNEAGALLLDNREDRQLWLVQGYLLRLAPTVQNAAPKNTHEPKEMHSRTKSVLTGLGLVLLIILFAYVFIGTVLFMMQR
jgi:hypothetical protein